jgi:beta-N-acetylhexosaminidase
VDPSPAGFSTYWIERELRERVGFGGAVFSDDLSMKATAAYGTMAERARLSLDSGCDMILVCNDRDAAHEAVDALADYTNPLSLVRLARLHGTGQPAREELLASAEWQTVNGRFVHWSDRPEFHLDA